MKSEDCPIRGHSRRTAVKQVHHEIELGWQAPDDKTHQVPHKASLEAKLFLEVKKCLLSPPRKVGDCVRLPMRGRAHCQWYTGWAKVAEIGC